MMTHLLVLWELIINILEAGIFYYFINKVLTLKKQYKDKFTPILVVSLQIPMVSICNLLEVAPIYTIALGCIFKALYAIKFYKEKKVTCFIWGCVGMLLCVIAELLAFLFISLFTSAQANDLLFGEEFRFISTTLYTICHAGLAFFVSLLNPKKALFKTHQKIFIFFTMFTGVLMNHCFMYMLFNIDASQTTLSNITLIANFVFLAFFIFLLVYIYQLAYTQQENQELQERTQLLELEENQYNNLLSTTESLREIKHDIHHHLSTIHSFIQNDELERLNSYLKEYQTHFELDYKIASTGNIVIDSILSTKMYAAKQQNTQLNFTVHLPDEFPFSDVTLSALLGNLFDNALEACSHVSVEKKRWINFHMKTQENMLVIHIDNSFDGIVKKTVTQGFLSRKEEPNHGIGLKRVSTLVEEADGFIEIDYDDQCFTVQIMVPLEDRDEA